MKNPSPQIRILVCTISTNYSIYSVKYNDCSCLAYFDQKRTIWSQNLTFVLIHFLVRPYNAMYSNMNKQKSLKKIFLFALTAQMAKNCESMLALWLRIPLCNTLWAACLGANIIPAILNENLEMILPNSE